MLVIRPAFFEATGVALLYWGVPQAPRPSDEPQKRLVVIRPAFFEATGVALLYWGVPQAPRPSDEPQVSLPGLKSFILSYIMPA